MVHTPEARYGVPGCTHGTVLKIRSSNLPHVLLNLVIVLNLVQGRAARERHLCRKITVTLSIFNFRTSHFAQIVENRRGRLSRAFLGPGDIFSKSYDENQIRPK